MHSAAEQYLNAVRVARDVVLKHRRTLMARHENFGAEVMIELAADLMKVSEILGDRYTLTPAGEVAREAEPDPDQLPIFAGDSRGTATDTPVRKAKTSKPRRTAAQKRGVIPDNEPEGRATPRKADADRRFTSPWMAALEARPANLLPVESKTCARCGEVFVVSPSKQQFCSWRCLTGGEEAALA